MSFMCISQLLTVLPLCLLSLLDILGTGQDILLLCLHVLQLALVKLLHTKHSHVMLSSRVLYWSNIFQSLGICSLDSRQQLRVRLALGHDDDPGWSREVLQGGVGGDESPC